MVNKNVSIEGMLQLPFESSMHRGTFLLINDYPSLIRFFLSLKDLKCG